ncbi:MAG: hypothetical protein H0Z32_09500 [Bacillaceae bacterium]|nr:hypothetical protein [Bacillaceae bacterium]
MKKISIHIVIILISVTLSACGSEEETILSNNSDNNQHAEQSDQNNSEKKKDTKDLLVEKKIIFGDKKGERELDARNLFKLGENAYFLVTLEKAVETDAVTIILNKLEEDKWVKLTEGPLEVKPEWKQFMNGLPGTIFQKTGPGAYQLIVKKGDEELAKGEFIIQDPENNDENS